MTSSSILSDDLSGQNHRETKDGNSKLWVSVDESNCDSICRSSRTRKLDYEDSLPLVSPTRIGKINADLLKRGGNKFVAAIKSLQCSPRVGASNHSKLKEGNIKDNSSNNSISARQPFGHGFKDCFQLEKTDSYRNHNRQEQQRNHQQPAFVANFENFILIHDELPLLAKDYISKNLEFESVIEHLDVDPNVTFNNLVILKENSFCDDQLKTASNSLYNETNCSIRMSSSNPKHLIETDFSQSSNESIDTPVTCNKSVRLTPNNSRKGEKYSGDNKCFYCKPPKEVFHRSLSLGDSLSPSETDSPCRAYLSTEASEESCSVTSNYKVIVTTNCDDAENNQEHDYSSASSTCQQQIDKLNIPVMNERKGMLGSSSAEESASRGVQQIKKLQVMPSFTSATSASSACSDACAKPSDVFDSSQAAKIVVSNEKIALSVLKDDASVVSSTVSSFVFSEDSGHNLEYRVNQSLKLAPTSSSLYWKIHPRQHEERGMHQKEKRRVVSTEPILPAFFWKTHPLVTIKSYNFQQRKAGIRKLNQKNEVS